jgi:hypothetical protein
MSQKNKRGLQRGLSEIVQLQTAPLPDKSKESSDLISRFRDQPGTGGAESTPHTETTPGTNYTPPPVQITPDAGTTPRPDFTPRKGFLQLHNHFIYDIMPTLKPSDGYVLLYLIARTHGFQQTQATIALNRIASACHMSRSQARISLRALEARGHIRIAGKDENNPDSNLRGHVIEVLVPRVDSKPRVDSTPGTKSTPIKEKDYKRNNKEIASLDTTKCPDCDGMGVRYIDPLDYSKGTVKCKHEKLKPSPGMN